MRVTIGFFAILLFLVQTAVADPNTHVLGVRPLDAHDALGGIVTRILQNELNAARESPSMKQEIAAFGCSVPPPANCFWQIANDLRATRLVTGVLTRPQRGGDFQLRLYRYDQSSPEVVVNLPALTIPSRCQRDEACLRRLISEHLAANQSRGQSFSHAFEGRSGTHGCEMDWAQYGQAYLSQDHRTGPRFQELCRNAADWAHYVGTRGCPAGRGRHLRWNAAGNESARSSPRIYNNRVFLCLCQRGTQAGVSLRTLHLGGEHGPTLPGGESCNSYQTFVSPSGGPSSTGSRVSPAQ